MATQAKARPSRKAIGSDEAYAAILDGARRLRIRCSLSLSKQNMFREAVDVLQSPQSSRSRQEYRVFLYEVAERCGPHGILLCATELGQHKITTMRKSERAVLIGKLQEVKTADAIDCPMIRSLAKELVIPQIAQGKHRIHTIGPGIGCIDGPLIAPLDSTDTLMRQMTEPGRQGVQGSLSDAANMADLGPSSGYPYPDLSHGSESLADRSWLGSTDLLDGTVDSLTPGSISGFGTPQELHHSASMAGIASILGNFWHNIIRRAAPVDIGNSTPRGSLTAYLPLDEESADCLLKLDISPAGAEYLASILFNAEIQGGSHATQIAFDNGSKLALAVAAGATWKGAPHQALFSIFDTQVCCAVMESKLYQRELKQGLQVTNCVSMTLTADGATVDVTLGARQALGIIYKFFV
ncbi:hypothetical protein HC256_008285 [Beauveria bassiana]|nr:hypothetical protein HC256_008285 [Beauveria bassiana]